MENQKIQMVLQAAKKKEAFFDQYPVGYVLYAAMAGVFCGLGMMLAYTVGGNLNSAVATQGLVNIGFGLSFALSFTLIVFAGSELFTGNVMVLSIGAMDKKVSWSKAFKMLIICYLSNFIGATLIALLLGSTGLLNNPVVGAFLVERTILKMELTFIESFTRGILCNMMVCLGVWATCTVKSESAKMMLLLWCVFGFCTTGYEHSIANMALFIMAKTSSFATQAVNISGYLNNMIPVTLGNLVGGGLIIGWLYYTIGKNKIADEN